MRVIHYASSGRIDSLHVKQLEMPKLPANQVMVKVTAFGINRADTLQRQGKYPPPAGESNILGLEVAGEVVEQGAEVENDWLGKAVFGLVAGGGYAEYVCVDPAHLMLVPEQIDVKLAAGIAEVFLTAFQSLCFLGQYQAGQKLLIHAGASGVGLAAIQLAKRHGCRVATTASSEEKLALCQEFGADLLINYQQQDFAKQIKQDFGKVDIVIDFVGGDYLNRNLSVLNTDGKIIYLAMLAGRYADQLNMAMLLSKRATIQGSTLRNRSDEYKADLIKAFTQHCLPGFDTGELVVNLDTFIHAERISEAHERLENNATMGKLIGYW